MLHKISILILFFFTGACMKIQKKGGGEPPNEPPAQVANIQDNTDKLDYTYNFTDEVQKVIFQFPTNWPDQIVVEKLKSSEKIFQHELINGSHTWSDSMYENYKASYKFFEKKQDQLVLIDEIEVIPALELNLNSELNLSEVYNLTSKVKKIYFHHLTLSRNAKIFIGDFKGRIEIENINSDSGVIQTFQSQVHNQKEKNGRSVGGFDFQVKNGHGKLLLNLIAESGADGKPGREPDEALTGAPGREGQAATFSVVAPNPICSGLCLYTLTYECDKPPGPGYEGGQGLRGYPGEDGGNGGSIEKVNILNNSTEFTVQVYNQPGKKGIAGRGASGGRGGPAGKGGDGIKRDLLRFLKLDPNDPKNVTKLNTIIVSKPCAPAQDGPVGIRGEQGVDGHDGIDGIVF